MDKRMRIVLCLLILGIQQQILSSAALSTPEQFKGIEQLILEKMKKEGLPSIAVAVARDGKILWEQAWGLANIEKQIPATENTMYSIASVSKPITSTGLMILVERGLVDLEKPANQYLGEGKLTGYLGGGQESSQGGAEATVCRVLHHTAGLPMHWNLIFADGSASRPGMDVTIGRYGILVTPPGEDFNYSNLGYGIIDHIISLRSGMDYPDFMKKEVFEPLGMTRTEIFTQPGPEEDVAQRYGQGQKLLPFYDFDHRGASAVFTSAHDLVRFGMFHLKNRLPEQKAILSKKSIDLLHNKKDPRVPKSNYAMGWSNYKESGIQFFSHSGGMMGVGSRLTLLPKENVVCVLLTNGSASMMGSDLWELEWDILKASIKGFPEKPEPEAQASSPAGFTPPDEIVGTWKGGIRIEGGTVPAKLTIEESGKVDLDLDGKVFPAITFQTPLGGLRFNGGVFLGQFMAALKTPDTARSPHILSLSLKLRGNRFDGSVCAVSYDQRTCFTHWIELERMNPQPEN